MKTKQQQKLYYQSDTLQKHIDWNVIMELEREAGGHDEQMQQLFKGSEVIAHYNSGNYSGIVATCVKITTGEYVIYNDYYGSCSGCDAWEGAADKEVKAMCIQLSNNAYIFKSINDVILFLSVKEEGEDRFMDYRWFDDYYKAGYNLLKEIYKSLNKSSETK